MGRASSEILQKISRLLLFALFLTESRGASFNDNEGAGVGGRFLTVGVESIWVWAGRIRWRMMETGVAEDGWRDRWTLSLNAPVSGRAILSCVKCWENGAVSSFEVWRLARRRCQRFECRIQNVRAAALGQTPNSKRLRPISQNSMRGGIIGNSERIFH